MKEGIHPKYVESTVMCVCGNTFKTMSTKPVIKLEICSNCHPFFTGKQKLIDSGGRVERFKKKFALAKTSVTKKKKKILPAKAIGRRTLTSAPKKVRVSIPQAKPKKSSEKKESGKK
jgi:large subunit ribosomal protein L31